jgi:hypothetical protein
MILSFSIFKIAFLLSPFLVLRIAGITLSDYLFMLAFVLTFLQAKARHAGSKILSKLYFPLILIFLFASISTFVNPDKVQSSITVAKFIILIILIPWTSRILCTSKDKLDGLVKSYLVGLVFFSIYINFDRLRNFGPSTSIAGARESGLAQHVTDAGGICTISVLSCLVFISQEKRFLKLAATLICVLALIFTGSISGYIATLIGSLVFVYRNNRTFVSKKNLIYLSSMSVFLFIIERNFEISGRISHATSGRYDTASSRVENWRIAIDSSSDNLSTFLFGNGLHPKNNVLLASTGELLAPHNILLECLSAGGVFFAIGIFMFLAQILIGTFKVRSGYDFLPLLVASFTFAMTSPLMYSRFIWLPFLLALQNSVLLENKNAHLA